MVRDGRPVTQVVEGIRQAVNNYARRRRRVSDSAGQRSKANSERVALNPRCSRKIDDCCRRHGERGVEKYATRLET